MSNTPPTKPLTPSDRFRQFFNHGACQSLIRHKQLPNWARVIQYSLVAFLYGQKINLYPINLETWPALHPRPRTKQKLRASFLRNLLLPLQGKIQRKKNLKPYFIYHIVSPNFSRTESCVLVHQFQWRRRLRPKTAEEVSNFKVDLRRPKESERDPGLSAFHALSNVDRFLFLGFFFEIFSNSACFQLIWRGCCHIPKRTKNASAQTAGLTRPETEKICRSMSCLEKLVLARQYYSFRNR